MPLKYILKRKIEYYSPRYNRWVTVPKGYMSDGATWATDITGPVVASYGGYLRCTSMAWWVHDKLCDTGKFDDGFLCNNWQASCILYDILRNEGRTIRDFWWLISTYLFGGGKARENGMFKIRKEK